MFTDRLLDGFYKDIWSDEEKRIVDEAWWGKQTPYKDPNQIEMEFLWPHRGVQLELDLDKPEQPVGKNPYIVSNGTGFTIVPTLWGTTAIGPASINSPSFEINISDSVGNLKIGGMSVGLKESPKWYQRILYKLLGFDWKNNG